MITSSYQYQILFTSKTMLTKQNKAKIKDLINDLFENQLSSQFRQPVDWKMYGMVYYPIIIQNPMDLSTVKKKLRKNSYATVQDCLNQIELIFQNSWNYNYGNQWIIDLTNKCQKAFRDQLNKSFPQISTAQKLDKKVQKQNKKSDKKSMKDTNASKKSQKIDSKVVQKKIQMGKNILYNQQESCDKISQSKQDNKKTCENKLELTKRASQQLIHSQDKLAIFSKKAKQSDMGQVCTPNTKKIENDKFQGQKQKQLEQSDKSQLKKENIYVKQVFELMKKCQTQTLQLIYLTVKSQCVKAISTQKNGNSIVNIEIFHPQLIDKIISIIKQDNLRQQKVTKIESNLPIKRGRGRPKKILQVKRQQI